MCYVCGKPGHFAKQCRYWKEEVPSFRPLNQGHIFALSQQGASHSPSLIKGTLMIQGVKIVALFDSSATHSFISFECARILGLEVCDLSHKLCVSTPTRTQVFTSQFYSKCLIQFGETYTSLDLVCLSLQNIDVIIRMDWLAENHALLDCFAKTISLPLWLSKTEVSDHVFDLNTTRIESHLKCPCEGYIVLYCLQAISTRDFSEMPVIREYPDVFPEEVNGLPPSKEVEFTIDLVPGSNPISEALYRMALIKLAELKKQLEELLKKGFIRLSVSL